MKNLSFLCWLTSDKWPELQKRQEFPPDELAPWWKLLSPWREIQGYIITVSWKHVQTSNVLNNQNVHFAKTYFVRGGKIISILSIDIQCHLFLKQSKYKCMFSTIKSWNWFNLHERGICWKSNFFCKKHSVKDLSLKVDIVRISHSDKVNWTLKNTLPWEKIYLSNYESM